MQTEKTERISEKLQFLDYYHEKGLKEISGFWERAGTLPIFSDKKVLDFGCGCGSFVKWLLTKGASSVTGIDLESDVIEYSKEKFKLEYPEYHQKVSFFNGYIQDYPGEDLFDLAVSKDVFEHVMDIPAALLHIKRVLKPGGKLFIGAAPLYYSPYGHHNVTHKGLIMQKIPWIHALENEDKIIKRINQRIAPNGPYASAVTSIEDLGLNKRTHKEIQQAVEKSGFKIVRALINSDNHILKPVFNQLRKITPLEKYFTYNIYYELEK